MKEITMIVGVILFIALAVFCVHHTHEVEVKYLTVWANTQGVNDVTVEQSFILRGPFWLGGKESRFYIIHGNQYEKPVIIWARHMGLQGWSYERQNEDGSYTKL